MGYLATENAATNTAELSGDLSRGAGPGNPGGRPKELRDVIELARLHTTDAIETLAAAMNSDSAPWAVRISAANAILDRGWGKPKETTEARIGVS